MKSLLLAIGLSFLCSSAYAACAVSPSQVINTQQWQYDHEPIISRFIQNEQESFIIAYQRNTSHALEFEMVKGCWTGKVQVISLASFRQLFGAMAFDRFTGAKAI